MSDYNIRQYDLSQPIQETVTFETAVNLTAAGVQFLYRLPDGTENILLEAEIVSSSPSIGAATSVVVKNVWTDNAVAVADGPTYPYEWKFTLASQEVIVRSVDAATEDFPERANKTFKIVPSMSSGPDDDSEDINNMTSRPIAVLNIAELIALPASNNYRLAFVEDVGDGNLGSFIWDDDIVATDAEAGEYVLTAGGGGWRRQGL